MLRLSPTISGPESDKPSNSSKSSSNCLAVEGPFSTLVGEPEKLTTGFQIYQTEENL